MYLDLTLYENEARGQVLVLKGFMKRLLMKTLKAC